MRVVAVIQARTGSTRLPGKVLEDLAGEPILARVVSRTARAASLDEVVVATTDRERDDPIVALCQERGWLCFRGSEEDVLDRTYRAARGRDAEAVVRITSDCPLIDPSVVERVVGEFLEAQPGIDYACNVWPKRTYPRGLDTEVIRFDVLERLWREDDDPAGREHVTINVRRHPETFELHGVLNDVDYSDMRWTVDTAEDLEFVRRVCGHFGHDEFSWLDVLALLEENPGWLEINRHVKQKAV